MEIIGDLNFTYNVDIMRNLEILIIYIISMSIYYNNVIGPYKRRGGS